MGRHNINCLNADADAKSEVYIEFDNQWNFFLIANFYVIYTWFYNDL